MSSDLASWAVVETYANAERLAERSLRQRGYEPLVVRYQKLIKGARHDAATGRRIRSRSDELQLRPFIPGYLFLPLGYGDDALAADTDLGSGKPPGVKRVLRDQIGADGRARPKLIRATIIEQIKATAMEKDLTPEHSHQHLRDRLNRGEQVRVRHPLGFTATLLALDDQDRARYVAWLFGREINGTINNAAELELVTS